MSEEREAGQFGLPSERLSEVIAEALAASGVATGFALAQELSGPLPRAEEFAQYGVAVPDAPARILSMAERSQQHRMRIEERDSRVDAALGLMGIGFAFLLAVLVLGGSMWLIADGKQVAGTILATFDLVALVTSFVLGRRAR